MASVEQSVASAEQLGFNLQTEPTSEGIKLTATPPRGFKVNEKYPHSARTLDDQKLHRPVLTNSTQIIFKIPTNQRKDLAIALAYCNSSLCKIDQRKLHWDQVRSILLPKKIR